jgi:NSS family neurotransmitter:Na+ symporter
VSAFRFYSKSPYAKAGGWLNAIVPMLICPYYSVIGGWVCKYLFAFLTTDMDAITSDTFFTEFITNGVSAEFWFFVFLALTLAIIYMGVENGIERVSKFMMPILLVLAIVISVYTITRPGAMAGVAYLLIPHLENFSWMTVVSAMGQMFYSLSIAMGILITFGSYMKKDVSIEDSTRQVEFFDTAIAILAGMMIIPAVFAFSGGDPEHLNAGPSLMFITMPKIFASMGFGRMIGILFFTLVLFAALTSSIALTESAVSTIADEFKWSRFKCTTVMAVIMLSLGTLSCLGYGPLAFITIIGMPFLDFFDFLTNSVMMPIAALAICLLVTRCMGLERLEQEVEVDGHPFRRKKIFRVMIRYIAPLFVLIILLSSIANAFGLISM